MARQAEFQKASLRPGVAPDPELTPTRANQPPAVRSQVVVHTTNERMRQHIANGYWGADAAPADRGAVAKAIVGLSIGGATHVEPPEHPQASPVKTYEEYSRSDQRRIAAHARGLGLTPKVIRANAGDLMDQGKARAAATGGTNALGHHWYSDEHQAIVGRARDEGVDQGKLTAVTAALSPTVPWERGGKKVNLDLATHAARLHRDNPQVTITPAHASHLQRVQENAASNTMMGRSSENWHSYVGTHHVNDLPSHVVATLASFSGKAGVDKHKDETGNVTHTTPSPAFASHGIQGFAALQPLAQARSRQNVTKAMDILRGHATADDALNKLGSPKPRTFNDNLSAPYDNPARVTVDRWAVRGVANTDSSNDSGVISRMKVGKGRKGDPIPQASDEAQHQGVYAFIQHHIARASAERGLHGQEGQAIAWTHVKGEHEGFGQFDAPTSHSEGDIAGLGAKDRTGAEMGARRSEDAASNQRRQAASQGRAGQYESELSAHLATARQHPVHGTVFPGERGYNEAKNLR